MSGRKKCPQVMGAKGDEELAEASTAAAPAEAPCLSPTDGGVWFVLEKVPLEAAKVGKAMLAILDSPLNKAGKLKGLYIRSTEKNVLIQINPHFRVPRTFKRFSGLMVQLLQKLVIRATNGPDKLMKVVKQPVTRYLPLGARRIDVLWQWNSSVTLCTNFGVWNDKGTLFLFGWDTGMSYSAPKVVLLRDYITATRETSPLVFESILSVQCGPLHVYAMHWRPNGILYDKYCIKAYWWF